MATSPFLELPPELRVKIYEYALPATGKLVPQHTTRASWPAPAGKPYRGTALLLVNRLICEEAQDVMYKFNTFSVPKATFCATEPPCSGPVLKLEMVVHLRLSTFMISKMCAKHVNNGLGVCDICRPLSAIPDIISKMPELRTIIIDYGADRPSQIAFRLLKSNVRKSDQSLSLTCVGVGEYQLNGPALKNTAVSLVHGSLAALWHELTIEKSLTESPLSYEGESLDVLLQVNIRELLNLHTPVSPNNLNPGPGFIPTVIADVWSLHTAVNILDITLIRELGIMEEFDVAIQHCAHTSATGRWDLRMKW